VRRGARRALYVCRAPRALGFVFTLTQVGRAVCCRVPRRRWLCRANARAV